MSFSSIVRDIIYALIIVSLTIKQQYLYISSFNNKLYNLVKLTKLTKHLNSRVIKEVYR